MIILHDVDSVWWRQSVFKGNITFSRPKWDSVRTKVTGILCTILIRSVGAKQCSLVTLSVPQLRGSESILCFMNILHSTDSFWWRQSVFTINTTFSGPIWFSVRYMIHVVHTSAGLIPTYVSWIICTIYIRSVGAKYFSLGTLFVPRLCGFQSSIKFMNILRDLNSVWWRQKVFIGIIMCSGPMWVSVRHMFHEYYPRSRLGLMEANSIHLEHYVFRSCVGLLPIYV
jgi:hypothetical protein